MTTSLDGTSRAWSKIAEKWITYFKPPSRPSNSEVQAYRQMIESYAGENAQALVLGATPELLDLLADANIQTDLIDISQEMVSAMLEIAKPFDRGVNIGNWLEMPFEDNSYDLILGDAVIQNVPYESRADMIKEILRVLKPGGKYLNRSFCVPENKQHNSIDEILFAFRDKPVDETTAIELIFEIQILNYDTSDHLAAVSDIRDVVMKLRTNDGFNRENDNENQILNILWEYWLKDISDKVWVYDTRANEEAFLYQGFSIEEVFEANDHPYGDLTPLYCLNADK